MSFSTAFLDFSHPLEIVKILVCLHNWRRNLSAKSVQILSRTSLDHSITLLFSGFLGLNNFARSKSKESVCYVSYAFKLYGKQQTVVHNYDSL